MLLINIYILYIKFIDIDKIYLLFFISYKIKIEGNYLYMIKLYLLILYFKRKTKIIFNKIMNNIEIFIYYYYYLIMFDNYI